MECKVKSDPKPDIIWFRNGEVIKESNKLKMSMEQRGDQYYIKLELLDPQLEDSGLYKCNIKNTLGELNANLTLNIESEYKKASKTFQNNLKKFQKNLLHIFSKISKYRPTIFLVGSDSKDKLKTVQTSRS